jgi:glycerophosphoryl diester phosphodiesterase
MDRLKFTPKWISFHYTIVNEEMIRDWRQKGYCVSVWGIQDEETKNRIKALKPDAVIY